jgi:hypothetical protein
MLKESLP